MKRDFDRHHGALAREYQVNDKVYAVVYEKNRKRWAPGKVIAERGAHMYDVQIASVPHVRHANQMEKRYSDDDDASNSWDDIGVNLALMLPLTEESTPADNDVGIGIGACVRRSI